MSNDLFDDKNVDLSLDPEKDYFAELVGEGKKYKDEKALARSRLEADRHLARIEQENAGLRQELQNRMKLEEIVDNLAKPRTLETVLTPDPVAPVQQNQQVDLDALLEQKLSEREKQKKRDENFAAVQAAMARAFGSNYVEVLKQKAQEMGTSPQRFNELALTEPEFLLKLVGAENTPHRGNDLFTPPPASHSQGFKPVNTERNKAYYDKIKKENPSLYWSKETQMAMHKDADKLGERFFV